MSYRTVRGKHNSPGVGEVTLSINPDEPDSINIYIASGFRTGSGDATVPLARFRAAFAALDKTTKENR